MATQEPESKAAQSGVWPQQGLSAEAQVKRILELYGDAPEIGRKALANVAHELEAAIAAQHKPTTAGRIGLRQGKVSELTVIAPLAPGGAKRLRAVLDALGNHFQNADKVGTLHDMRFVFVDNDTKLLFATAYDGDWDAYIDDFSSKIADDLDLVFSNIEGWPGIRNPGVKDWIVKHQVPAAAWYVSNSDLSVAETSRMKRIGNALEQFLDRIG